MYASFMDEAAVEKAGLKPLLDALLLQRKDGSWVALLPLQLAALLWVMLRLR